MCREFWAAMGPTLTYRGSYLLTCPVSGFWEVLMVEFAVAAAIFLLRDVFSSWTLWYLPPKLIQILRQLDLTIPLGSLTSS